MKGLRCGLLAVFLSGIVWGVEPTTYNTHAFSTNDPIDSIAAEVAFLDAVATGGFSTFSEDFEASVWNATRSPGYVISVLSHGITWHSSAGDGLRSTRDSDSYENPQPYMIWGHDPASEWHPVPNTVIGESETKLYGIGFWADGTGTKGKIKVIFDDAFEEKFQRITGYDHNPPDPPEPIKETVRLDYSKEFFGVYVPEGFNKFQLLEFAGEPDEVVLMWMRTFTFAYLPPVPTEDIQITNMDYGISNLQIRFTATPVHSNFTLQANANLLDPVGWSTVTNPAVAISQNVYRVTAPLPSETNKMFRILSTP